MIFLLLTFFAWAEVEEAEISLNQLIPEASRRHISTVVESRITRQFVEVPQIAECAEQHRVTIEDVQDPNRRAEVKRKQEGASRCVRDRLADVSDEDLERMSTELGLKQHGLIKGTGSRAITDYFTSRFQSAFFVPNPDRPGKFIPLILDQKMFFDLYESQLGKSVLLEISNFCYNQLTLRNNPSTGNRSTDRKALFTTLNDTNLSNPPTLSELQLFSDRGYGPPSPAASATGTPATGTTPQPNPDQIYEDFMRDVVGVTGDTPPTQAQKEKLRKIYEECGKLIIPMCKVYEECSCAYRKSIATDPNTVNCTVNLNATGYNSQCLITTTAASATASTTSTSAPAPGSLQEPEIGANACHVAGRMRAHRANLKAVNAQQSILNNPDFYLTENSIGFKEDQAKGPKRYRSGEQSLDDLTSLSSQEIGDIQEQAEFSAECEESPDDETCKDFVYGADEAAKFKNTTASYVAATQIEAEKLRRLGGSQSTDELKQFLTNKGYLDLVNSLEEGGMDSQEVANEAIQRFEAQREATFAEMSKAFERNQIAGEDNPDQKIQQIKSEYQNKPDEFKQLMLFNNVVTSFLDVEKRNQDGTYESVGVNVRSLTRETENNSALEGLNQLAGESTLGNSDAPIVDQEFIGSILNE